MEMIAFSIEKGLFLFVFNVVICSKGLWVWN